MNYLFINNLKYSLEYKKSLHYLFSLCLRYKPIKTNIQKSKN